MTDTTAGEGVLAERLAKAFAERDGFTWTNERVLMTGRGGSRTRLTFVRQAEEYLAIVEKAGLTLAAQPSAGAEGEVWLPIATAPKDGTEFEARCGEYAPFKCEWDGDRFIHHDFDDGPIAYNPDQWRTLEKEWRCASCGAAADERHNCCQVFKETATPAQLATGDVAGLHHSTAFLVDRFAAALKEKLAKAEAKYGYRDGWRDHDWHSDLVAKLVEHVHKGDPRDVAAYCAFAWHHGWSITPPDTGDVAALREGVAALQDLLTATKINCDGEPESVAFASGVIEAYETFRLAALSKPNAQGREG